MGRGAFFLAGCSLFFAQQTMAQTSGPSSEQDKLVLPRLDFVASPSDARNYDKYFYFHRDSTTFNEAYADIVECDALSSGARINLEAQASTGSYGNTGSVADNYLVMRYGGVATAIGTVIGKALENALVGGANRREKYRENIRTCMGFKEYKRYPLNHDLWEKLNFLDSSERDSKSDGSYKLKLQALVASSATPAGEELPK